MNESIVQTKIKVGKKIHASTETVWRVLTGQQYIHLWCTAFTNLSTVESSWNEGDKIFFIETVGNGLIGQIATRNEHTIVVNYIGILTGGLEDYESEVAKLVKGKIESYQVDKINDTTTTLTIEADVDPQYYDRTLKDWQNVLEKIKQLAESPSIL